MGIYSVHLKNIDGIHVEISNYGATLMRIEVPDLNGKLVDIVVGLPKTNNYASATYQYQNFYLGATVGRYAGRISKGGFSLNGRFYKITHDEGIQLHGGPNGLDKQVWDIVAIEEGADPFVLLKTTSPAGHNGFPGNLEVFAKYQLLGTSLQIEYTARTDVPTILNLTNHAYFNLNGKGTVANHELQLQSNRYLELSKNLIPTGSFLKTDGSPFDFKESKRLAMLQRHPLDTPFEVGGKAPQAILYSRESGIRMEVSTNQPCIVLFTPNDFSDMRVRNAEEFKRFPAICLECQNFPDAPNQPTFPTAKLTPGETYRNAIKYQFT